MESKDRIPLVCLCLYISMCVCVCVCVCIYIYICFYILLAHLIYLCLTINV